MGRKPLEIDKIVMDLVLAEDALLKKKLAKKIWDIAYKKGIYPSSIHDYYMARGREEFTGSTVPAINLRSLTYDLARAIFRVGKKNNAKAFLFEIAKSEMGYTAQPPVEYSAVILAGWCQTSGAGPAAPPAPAMMSLVQTSTWISREPNLAAKHGLEASAKCSRTSARLRNSALGTLKCVDNTTIVCTHTYRV